MIKSFLSLKVNKTLFFAIFLVVTAGIFVSLMQGIVRFLSLELDIFVIVFFRAFLAVLIISSFSLKIGKKVFISHSPKLQLLRGILGSIAMVCFFWGLSMITLAETTTIGFMVPIFATLLAIICYKTRYRIQHWISTYNNINILLGCIRINC